MSRQRNKTLKKNREDGAYNAISHQFLRSQTLRSLTPKANKLLLDMLSQFNGFNNGDICITWKLMRQRGWRSKDTLNKARKELLDMGVIEIARRGGLNRASLYALTLFAVNECKGKLDITPTTSPKSIYLRNESGKPLKKSSVR